MAAWDHVDLLQYPDKIWMYPKYADDSELLMVLEIYRHRMNEDDIKDVVEELRKRKIPPYYIEDDPVIDNGLQNAYQTNTHKDKSNLLKISEIKYIWYSRGDVVSFVQQEGHDDVVGFICETFDAYETSIYVVYMYYTDADYEYVDTLKTFNEAKNMVEREIASACEEHNVTPKFETYNLGV